MAGKSGLVTTIGIGLEANTTKYTKGMKTAEKATVKFKVNAGGAFRKFRNSMVRSVPGLFPILVSFRLLIID